MSDSPKLPPITGHLSTTEEPDTLRANLSIHAPLPAEHPFYAIVGHVASQWSHLEHVLDLIIWELSKVEPARGACITAQIMGVGPRCRAIISLGSLVVLSDKVLKDCRQLMSDSHHVADLRARVVHDPWYISKGTDRVGQFKSMPYSDKRYGIREVEKEEIEDTLAKIKVLWDRANLLRRDVLDELEALRKRHAIRAPLVSTRSHAAFRRWEAYSAA